MQHRSERFQECLLGGESLRHGGTGEGGVVLQGLLEQRGDLNLVQKPRSRQQSRQTGRQ